jgi:hypothetical protein
MPAAVSLVALISTSLWLPRVPTAKADHDTWKLFGRPPAPGNWVNGDGAYPVPLQGGRVAWLFGDSEVRRADGTDALVHNTIVVQTSEAKLQTLAGGTSAQPADLIQPVQPGTWLWPSSGFVERGRLMVFAEEFTRPTGGGGFQATNRRYLVPFQIPDLVQGAPRAVYEGPVAWGHASLVNRNEVYVYGNLQRNGWTNLTYLARFPLGGSGGYWQFWNGHRFAPQPLTATPLRGPDGRALVAKIASVIPMPDPSPSGTDGGRAFAALTINPFANTIDMRIAPGPQGPWGAKQTLYKIPEPRSYLPHARTDPNGTVRLAYSVPDQRPRYLTVNW